MVNELAHRHLLSSYSFSASVSNWTIACSHVLQGTDVDLACLRVMSSKVFESFSLTTTGSHTMCLLCRGRLLSDMLTLY